MGTLPSLRQRDRRRVLWGLAKVTPEELPMGSSLALSSTAPLQVVAAVQSRVFKEVSFLFMVLIQLSNPSAEAPAETGGITVLFILADELEEF